MDPRGKINAYYYCPHHPEFGNKIVCSCRKPVPGLLFRAQKDWGIELSRSFMISDKADNVKAAQAAGVKSILVSTGYGTTERHLINAKTSFVRDIMMVSLLITTGELNLDVRHATRIS
jgi:D-glycero-D-manno-heptose 1,7-bisphosphate phosphatase